MREDTLKHLADEGGHAIQTQLGAAGHRTVSPAAIEGKLNMRMDADHIMLGTDVPYREVAPCIEYIQRSGLPADDVETILKRTAQRLLGVGAPRT